eukprot:jgi/Astpho2/9327/gw1.00142.44.1_t
MRRGPAGHHPDRQDGEPQGLCLHRVHHAGRCSVCSPHECQHAAWARAQGNAQAAKRAWLE